MDAASIISAVESVTKPWAKQRKAEERGSRRERIYYYSDRVNFTDIAEEILPKAYLHASGQGAYTVSQRQLYYASRDAFKEATDREIDYGYFSQTILRQFLNRNKVDWKITADARGTFSIPNTAFEKRVPVGTIQIDRYLENDRDEIDDDIDTSIPIEWPSMAEGQRYGAVLYIEKEGFEPLLQEAKIAERFDLAILSCKGQSVVAARKLVDHVCRVDGGVPLFIVHDFDKYGFEIAECLTKISDTAAWTDRVAYYFENEIKSIDFGLRLEDVQKYELAHEQCKANWGAASMTKAEVDYMKSGRRVELNAFTAPQFIEWLEGNLKKHLPKRLIPNDEILERAYRRALAVSSINSQIEEIRNAAIEESESAKIPKLLRKKIMEEMKKSKQPWDVALHSIAEGGFNRGN